MSATLQRRSTRSPTYRLTGMPAALPTGSPGTARNSDCASSPRPSAPGRPAELVVVTCPSCRRSVAITPGADAWCTTCGRRMKRGPDAG
jgi:hypothetical protein